MGCPNLALVHTMPSTKTARKLDAAAKELRPGNPLAVLVQVNTSAEECKPASPYVLRLVASFLCKRRGCCAAAKSGVEPSQAAELCRFVHVGKSALVRCWQSVWRIVGRCSTWVLAAKQMLAGGY